MLFSLFFGGDCFASAAVSGFCVCIASGWWGEVKLIQKLV